MKRLLVQSDDFGFTPGIVDGAIYGISHGIVRNTGIFVNMDCVEYAAKRLKEVDVCLGIDINMLAGKPVSEPKLIPNLVKENGWFRSSKDLNRDYKLLKTEKYLYIYQQDPFDYDQCVLETRAQVEKFISLFGKLPVYMNSHSTVTPNSERAAYDVAKEYGVRKMSSDLYFNPVYNDLAWDCYYELGDVKQQIDMDYVQYFLDHVMTGIKEGDTAFLMCHCGYPDKQLFGMTSLTMQRMNDVSAVTDPRVMQYIKDHDIELITYNDIVELDHH